MKKWAGIITKINTETSDGRIIEKVTWRELPLTLRAQWNEDTGHDGADNSVGRIDRIWIEGNDVMAEGTFMDTQGGRTAQYLVEEQSLRGVSVDAGAVLAEERHYKHGQLISPEDYWDVEPDKTVLAFAEYEISAATLVATPAVAEAYISIKEEPEAVKASGKPSTMPAEWFQKQDLTEPTKFTISTDGRMSGHLFQWDQCHSGYQGVCVRPAKQDEYNEFHCGETHLDNGETIPTGPIFYGGKHSPEMDSFRSDRDLQEHFENTCKQLGRVHLWPDEFGVQACGATFKDVPQADVDRCLSGFPSGEWWDFGGTGKVKMSVLLVVNKPAYAYTQKSGNTQRLVASLGQISGKTCKPGGTCCGACNKKNVEPVEEGLSLEARKKRLQLRQKLKKGDIPLSSSV